MLGDHQPHHYVSGADPGYDVPVTVIAQDPAVDAPDRRLGLVSPGCSRRRRPRSGGWTAFATGS